MLYRRMLENELSLIQSNFSEGHQSQRVTPIRTRREPFSLEEDDYLKEGPVEHGYGKWTATPRDPDFNFHNKKTCDSLMKRARILKSLQ